MLDQLDQCGNAQAIIQGFGPNAWSDPGEIRRKSRPIANFYLGIVAQSNINAERIDRDATFTLIAGRQMDGFGANHTRDTIVTNPDRFAWQLARVHTANRIKAKDAISIMVGQHETYFIHMGRKHHPQAFLSTSPEPGDEHIAERIYLYIVCKRANLIQYDGSHLALVTRDSASVAELSEQPGLGCANFGCRILYG
jgi:hypothetical protein